MDKFFTLHPYQYESKPQYMSALFYLNDAQREVAQAKIDKLKAGGRDGRDKATPGYEMARRRGIPPELSRQECKNVVVQRQEW